MASLHFCNPNDPSAMAAKQDDIEILIRGRHIFSKLGFSQSAVMLFASLISLNTSLHLVLLVEMSQML